MVSETHASGKETYLDGLVQGEGIGRDERRGRGVDGGTLGEGENGGREKGVCVVVVVRSVVGGRALAVYDLPPCNVGKDAALGKVRARGAARLRRCGACTTTGRAGTSAGEGGGEGKRGGVWGKTDRGGGSRTAERRHGWKEKVTESDDDDDGDDEEDEDEDEDERGDEATKRRGTREDESQEGGKCEWLIL